MAYGGPDTARRMTDNSKPRSLAGLVATAAELIGLLNRGSAKAPAAPSDVSDLQPISSNTLNVTRVGGVGSLISAAGGAALLLFNVNKAKDRPPIVVAAYLSVGVIVAAALLTVAIIIAADIRARTAIATAVSPKAPSVPENVKYISAVAAAGLTAFVVSLDRTYEYVLVEAAAASADLTLPNAESVAWQHMTILRADEAQTNVVVRPQGQQMISGQHERAVSRINPLHIYSDGQQWLAIP